MSFELINIYVYSSRRQITIQTNRQADRQTDKHYN